MFLSFRKNNHTLHKTYLQQKGFTLLELVIYVSILSLLMITVVTVLISMSQAYTTLKTSKNLNHAAVVSLERITREIRSAKSVIEGQSVFDSTPGRLYLQTSVSTTTEFYIDEGLLKVDINDVYQGPLTTEDVTINSLVFTFSTTTNSQAVGVSLILESGVGERFRSEHFYSTVVLRGSYNK